MRDFKAELAEIARLRRNCDARKSRIGPIHVPRDTCGECGQQIRTGPWVVHEANSAKWEKENKLSGELWEARFYIERWLRTVERHDEGAPEKFIIEELGNDESSE